MTYTVPWDREGLTPPKGETMVMTAENFDRVCRLRDELIHEQRVEIAKLKMRLNQREQKITQLMLRIERYIQL